MLAPTVTHAPLAALVDPKSRAPRIMRIAGFVVAALLVLESAPRAHAQAAPYAVERVETSGDVVRAFVVADLAPVEAVVRANASEAARRAAPRLFADRSVGTHRFREVRLDVLSVRFAPGVTSHDVRIDVLADITAERDHRTIALRGVVPEVRWVSDGRRRLGHGRLVVAVSVGIANGTSVVLRILGERLVLSDPIATDLDLERRVLHTHVQPIGSHPSIAGLTPEAAALRGIEGHRLRFVVRFRRR